MSKVIDLTGRPQSEWYSNPNLLDNWYFADPIDQRQGYVVPPDTPYYSDTGLSAQAGTVSAYTTANYVDGVYGSVSVDGVAYYVDWTAAVRGYRENRHVIDRWLLNADTGVEGQLTVVGGGISLSTGARINQYMEETQYKNLVGKTLTASALVNNSIVSGTVKITDQMPYTIVALSNGWRIAVGGVMTVGVNMNIFQLLNITGQPDDIAIAAKLELGPVQTLAHQNADGDWVLNDPPPNPTLELLKCQRYYQLFSSADTRPVNLADYRPTMRANPALGTININGQTMYFADANL